MAPRDRSRVSPLRIAFWATVLFAAATFWIAPRPPMADLPQHAAQIALLHDLLLGQSPWQSLVYVNWFTPYFAGYGPALLLSFVMPVLGALKLLLALAYVGFVAACVALRRALGGDERLDWLFVPSFFGIVYALGLYTFMLAAPLGMLFVLLALRYARAPRASLGAWLLVADLVLFFAHGLVFMFANAIGGIMLFLRNRSARLLRVAWPYAAVGLLCLGYSLARLRFETVPLGDPWPSLYWGWNELRFSAAYVWAGWSRVDPHNTLFMALFFLMLATPLLLRCGLNWREPSALVPFLVTLLIWLVVPRRAAGTDALYQRFGLFILPAYALMFRPVQIAAAGLRRVWLPLLCWIFLAVHTERLIAFARESAPFEEVLAAAAPAERALTVVFTAQSEATGSEAAYLHWPAWYQAERGGFVDFNFALFLPQIVRYRPERMPLRFSQEDWAQNPAGGFDWERDGAGAYRYFFVRRADLMPRDFFPERCRPVEVKASADWSLLENVRCRSATLTR